MRRLDYPEYKCWLQMRYRCSRPNHPKFKYYGQRGITVCREWSSFDTFLRDVGPRPSMRHTLDRIDNDGNYEPSNCRWVLPEQQNRKRRLPHTNSSGFRGVSWNKRHGKWYAFIAENLRNRNLGGFASAEEAARAYDSAAKFLGYPHSILNFQEVV